MYLTIVARENSALRKIFRFLERGFYIQLIVLVFLIGLFKSAFRGGRASKGRNFFAQLAMNLLWRIVGLGKRFQVKFKRII